MTKEQDLRDAFKDGRLDGIRIGKFEARKELLEKIGELCIVTGELERLSNELKKQLEDKAK